MPATLPSPLSSTRSRQTRGRPRISIRLPVALAGLALVAAACGSTSGGDDVATLESNDVATLVDAADAAVIPDEDAPETDPEEAALAFSQCMRDEGLDFPDLAIDAEGNINLRDGFQAVDRSDESVRDALEVCQPELAAGGFGGGRRAALESTEVQDGLVAFSDCVRDQGFDVGDLTLGQGPGPGQSQGAGQGQNDGAAPADGAAPVDGAAPADGGDGDGAGPPAGQRQGGFGNRSGRLAQQLGLDVEDPEVEAALETCQPILDEAFAAVGVGTGR